MRECWQALKKLNYGVYIVSAVRGEDDSQELSGMAVRMMTQVSTRPPRIAMTIAKSRRTHEFLQESGKFAVSILAQKQELLGGHFGLQSGRKLNKFIGLDYFTQQTGAPILNDCCAWFECEVETAHDMGNCTLFVAKLINAGLSDLPQFQEPLAYREEDYFG
jgi:flavin reductase (DIM6/NTAB) family NADH-FMN oxidoreductase RutF